MNRLQLSKYVVVNPFLFNARMIKKSEVGLKPKCICLTPYIQFCIISHKNSYLNKNIQNNLIRVIIHYNETHLTLLHDINSENESN